MKTYRDGTPVERDGTPVSSEVGPAAKATPQAGRAPEELPEPVPESGKDKAWRGNEDHQVGAKNPDKIGGFEKSVTSSNEVYRVGHNSDRRDAPGALDDACVTALILEVDLSSAAEALASAKIEAWVTVVTPSGPRTVGIQDYLRRLAAT